MLAVAVVALLLARSDSESRTPSAASTSASTPSVDAPPCNRAAARAAANRTAFVRGWNSGGSGTVLDFLHLRLLDCVDLTGDGAEEMVVRLSGRTPSVLGPWFIATAADGRWRVAIERLISTRERVRVTGSGVRETTTAYVGREPICCPSGKRSGSVNWNGRGFVYRPDDGIGDGRVRLADAEVVAIGPFSVQTGSLDEAIAAFGEPSSRAREGELCTAVWEDIGLTINFADLGRRNPCSAAGAVGTALLSGDAAAQAGWTIGKDLKVGSTQSEIRDEYPSTQRLPIDYNGAEANPGRDWSLVTRASPFGGGRTVSMAVRLNAGEAVGYTVFSAAAGG